jgi:hypothetical protein
MTNTLRKERARLAFIEAFNANKNDPNNWDLLIVYRRLLGENEHI